MKRQKHLSSLVPAGFPELGYSRPQIKWSVKCSKCNEAVTEEAVGMGWPIPRLSDAALIGPCCLRCQ